MLQRADLCAIGMTSRQITRAVRTGDLLRVRRDRYMLAAHGDLDRAVRVGGRLACVSLLAPLGVFVADASVLHIHLDHSMSRLRAPEGSGPLRSRDGIRLHWWRLAGPAILGSVGIADALAQAVRCQTPRFSVATVDSILHLSLLGHDEVRDVFDHLPRRYRPILRMVDASAESGPESLMRLILRQLGLRYRTQVHIPGVGRVDFVVEGWLIIECDSKGYHEGWAKQKVDRERDLAAAALGYTSLRPLAEHLLYRREVVVEAVRGLVAAHR